MKTSSKFVPIPDYPNYEINRRGQIQRRGKLMTPQFVAGGLAVVLSVHDNRTSKRLARLIGEEFCPEYREDLYPQYKDGNPRNCSAANLLWVKRGEIKPLKRVQ